NVRVSSRIRLRLPARGGGRHCTIPLRCRAPRSRAVTHTLGGKGGPMAWIHRLGVSALVLAPVVTVAQQPRGTSTARVIDRASQQPVAGATVRIVGTQRGAQSGDQGAYRITG